MVFERRNVQRLPFNLTRVYVIYVVWIFCPERTARVMGRLLIQYPLNQRFVLALG